MKTKKKREAREDDESREEENFSFKFNPLKKTRAQITSEKKIILDCYNFLLSSIDASIICCALTKFTQLK